MDIYLSTFSFIDFQSTFFKGFDKISLKQQNKIKIYLVRGWETGPTNTPIKLI
jgi:hypothetical protein